MRLRKKTEKSDLRHGAVSAADTRISGHAGGEHQRHLSGGQGLDGVFGGFLGGAARGIRTPDPIITNDVLYRLSYCGFSPDINDVPIASLQSCCLAAPGPAATRLVDLRGGGERPYRGPDCGCHAFGGSKLSH